MKVLKKEKEGMLVEISKEKREEGEATEAEHIPQEIKILLQQFQQVFSVPNGLPPSRVHDHAIVLKEGTSYQCSSL